MPSPDPKPTGRYKATRSEWTQLRASKVGPCRVCGRDEWIDLHHLIPRSVGGSDVAENLIPLCHRCHMAYEDHGFEWPHITERIRWSLTAGELAHVLDRKGPDWFDRYYPERRAA